MARGDSELFITENSSNTEEEKYSNRNINATAVPVTISKQTFTLREDLY